MMEPIIIAEFPKNGRERVRVTIDEFKGQTLIAIRVFYLAGDGEWRPGKSGTSMAVQHVENLATALVKAAAKARVLGLIAPSETGGG